jgi:hypothetical protein
MGLTQISNNIKKGDILTVVSDTANSFKSVVSVVGAVSA